MRYRATSVATRRNQPVSTGFSCGKGVTAGGGTG
jgi:hypothetical protein